MDVYGGRGKSVIDYILGDERTREEVKRVVVGERVESDHQPLIVWIRGKEEGKEGGGEREGERERSMNRKRKRAVQEDTGRRGMGERKSGGGLEENER